MFNRLIAIILLFLFSPLFLIIGIIIYIFYKSPILFIQNRIGLNGKVFKIYKFRTMKVNTPNVATHLLYNANQYVLKNIIFLRKLHLDELPNLINIIKGDMVFVGPRPALYNQKDLIDLRIASGIDKLKPGITGLAQIRGVFDMNISEKVELEKEYLVKKSFLYDILIIIETFKFVLKSVIY